MKTGRGMGLTCVAVGMLMACGHKAPSSAGSRQPAPSAQLSQEADERALGAAIIRAALDYDVGDARYFDSAIDLDGDGRPERVVYVAGPMACGTGGCSILVLAESSDGYRLVTRITVARTPIWASVRRTHGWRNLLVSIGGGGIAAGIAELKFDGVSYPTNPTWPPPELAVYLDDAQMLIPEFNSYRDGKPIGSTAPSTSVASPALGAAPPRDAKVPGTPYHATGQVPCSIGSGSQTAVQCEFGVIRGKPGNAEVHVTPPGGLERVLTFIGGMVTATGGAKVQATKTGDTWSVEVNNVEHYQIPDAVISGG